MKRNVDLTLNRDFQNNTRTLREITSLLSRGEINKPWICEDRLFSNNEDKGVLHTGNASDRKSKSRWTLHEEGVLCDKCGINNSNTKWNMVNMLCGKCDKELEMNMIRKQDLVLMKWTENHF